MFWPLDVGQTDNLELIHGRYRHTDSSCSGTQFLDISEKDSKWICCACSLVAQSCTHIDCELRGLLSCGERAREKENH